MPESPSSVDLAAVDPGFRACVPAGTGLLAHAVKVPPGPVDPPALAGDCFAMVLVAGVVRSEVTFANRVVAETLVSGDVLLPAIPRGDGFASKRTVSTLSWCVFACLDARFINRAARWPALMTELHARLSDQEHRIAVSGAISQLPRADERIEASFRQLATRLGIRSAGGTVLPIPMTHAAVGRMIGASRPTVSLALARLAELGRVTRRPDGHWLLAD